MFNCNYDEEPIVIMSTEKHLNKKIINIRESKYASIQPEYQPSAFFSRLLLISLLSKQECPLKQQHILDWKIDLKNVQLQNSSNPPLQTSKVTRCVYI